MAAILFSAACRTLLQLCPDTGPSICSIGCGDQSVLVRPQVSFLPLVENIGTFKSMIRPSLLKTPAIIEKRAAEAKNIKKLTRPCQFK